MACENEKINACKCGPMKQLMSISRAMDAPSQLCLLEESAGKIAAEFVYLIRRGFPLLFQATDYWTFYKECEKIYGTETESFTVFAEKITKQ